MSQTKILGNPEQKSQLSELLRKAQQDKLIKSVIEGKEVEQEQTENLSDYVRFGPFEYESKATEDTFSFNRSLERLRKAGYKRHPRPDEFFKLAMCYFEYCRELDALFKNTLINGKGEWLSMAMERQGTTIICYLDPENIKWDEDAGIYTVDGKKLKHNGKREFDYLATPDNSFIDVEFIRQDLVEFLYGRPYERFPAEIKNHFKPKILFPPEGEILPVGTPRGQQEFRYRMGAVSGMMYRTSRGIRPSHKK